jgi:hypothetical protein
VPFRRIRLATALAFAVPVWPGLAAAQTDEHSVDVRPATGWSRGAPIDHAQRLPYSVSCASRTLCVALDEYGRIASFDGSAWTSPARLFKGAVTPGFVECPATSFCLALRQDGSARTYDGASWSTAAASSAVTSPTSPALLRPSVCGHLPRADNSFDGSVWSTPQQVEGDSPLTAVSCPQEAEEPTHWST